jgi:hypothetical protein
MNQKNFGIFLGVVLILIAIWEFDWNSWTQIIISILLFLSGLSNVFRNKQSELIQKVSSFLLYASWIIIFFLVLKKLLNF